MQYFPYLLVLVSLSSLSLIILAILRILDFANVSSKQKIIILKISLTMIASAPFIFILLNLFSWHTVKITFSTKFINHLSISTGPVTFTESQSHWSFYIFTAYAIGFLVMLSQILSSYLIARKQLAGSTLSVIQEQTVYLNKHIQSPLSFGFPKTKIYFPWDTEKKWAPREIQMSLAHENIHLEQHDSLWKLLSLLIRALLFFVPWSYSLHRRFELEIEIFCDEKTCIITKANAEEYGGLLIAMTCVQPKNLIVTNITDSTLKRRLLAMKSRTIQRPLLTSMASAFLLIAGSTAIATASGITEEKTAFNIKSNIYIDGQLVSSPHIVTKDNASLEFGNKEKTQSMRIDLFAKNVTTSGAKKAIKINYDIQIQNNGNKMHFTPQLVVLPNQENTIRIDTNSGHTFKMRVLAVRE